MSGRPRAIKAHRVRRGQTTRILEGGKRDRKAVEACLARHNRGDV